MQPDIFTRPVHNIPELVYQLNNCKTTAAISIIYKKYQMKTVYITGIFVEANCFGSTQLVQSPNQCINVDSHVRKVCTVNILFLNLFEPAEG